MRRVPIDALTPYAHVADVQRSIDFYGRLGLEVRNRHPAEGRVEWAFLTESGDHANRALARLMLGVADEPVEREKQGVLFYCWSPDVRGLREDLIAAGTEVGPVQHPFYMQAGEFSVTDPDGYVVIVGQLDAPLSAS